MSDTAIKDEILDPMGRLFLPPRQMDAETQARALREYVDALRGFEREDLQAAWRTVRANAEARSWPPIAKFIQAAVQSRKERQARAPGRRERTRFDKPTAAELWEKWLKVRMTEAARDATEAGVAWSFKCRVLDGTELATISIPILQEEKRLATRTAEALQAGGPVYNRFRDKMVEFSDENRTMALVLWDRQLSNEVETRAEIMRAQGVRT